jgi:hypothetical protein
MLAKFPRLSRKSQLSIGGIEVAPATGLEVVIDTSPEVLTSYESFSKPRPRRRCTFNAFTKSSHFGRKQLWRRKPILWIGTGVVVFALGISAGVIIAWIVSRKGHVAAR